MTLDQLLPGIRDEIDHLMDGLEGGQLSVTEWHNQMVAVLGDYHTAAYLIGADIDTLTRADEQRILKAVADQVEHLNAFADVMDAESDFNEGWRSRAALYSGSIKGSYWAGWAGEDLPCTPGSCAECFGLCRCTLERGDDGIYWICADDHASCESCIERGNTWTPYRGGG